jgi:hypothetical protein
MFRQGRARSSRGSCNSHHRLDRSSDDRIRLAAQDHWLTSLPSGLQAPERHPKVEGPAMSLFTCYTRILETST